MEQNGVIFIVLLILVVALSAALIVDIKRNLKFDRAIYVMLLLEKELLNGCSPVKYIGSDLCKETSKILKERKYEKENGNT